MDAEREGPGFLAGCVAGTALWGVLAAITAVIALAAGWAGEMATDAGISFGGSQSAKQDRVTATNLMATLAEEYFLALQVAYVARYQRWAGIDPESLSYDEQQKRKDDFRDWQEERGLLETRFRTHLERTATASGPGLVGLVIVEKGRQGKDRVVLSSGPKGLFEGSASTKVAGTDIRRSAGTIDGRPVIAWSKPVYDRFHTSEPKLDWAAWVYFAAE
jgi:hypothetical protein